MKIKSTPGPWIIKRESMLDWHILCENNVPGHPGVVARVGFKPNAQLISVAPELLRTCKEILNYHERGVKKNNPILSNYYLNMIKQVIQKSEKR